MRKFILVAIALIIMSMMVIGCKKPMPKQAVDTSVSVRLGSARIGTMVKTIDVSGQIKALKWTTLSAKNPGRIVSVKYREGDWISAGSVIATQDTSDMLIQIKQAEAGLSAAKAKLSQAMTGADVSDTQTEASIAQAKSALDSAKSALQLIKKGARTQEVKSAENAVASAEANFKNAEISLTRTRNLYSQGAQSKQQMDMVQMQYDIASAQLDTAKQQLSIVKSGARTEEIDTAQNRVDQAAEAYKIALSGRSNKSLRSEDIKAARAGVTQAQSQLNYAKLQLNNAYIKSPISGIISKRNIEPGQYANPGMPLVEIVDLGSIYFEATVSEMDIHNIRKNQTVSVTVDAVPNMQFVGNISKILPTADSSSRQFTIQVSIPNRDGKLKPGMFVRGGIEVGRHKDVLIIPKDALVNLTDEYAVYTVDNDIASLKKVKLGYETREEIEVISGISLKEKLVVLGQDKLSDGVKVNAIN